MEDFVLRTYGLCRSFGSKIAVNNLNLNLRRGDIYGLIGPNGAGKTTAMKLILGLLSPTAGAIELFGQPICGSNLRRVGSLIEAPGIYKNCTAFENMKRFAILTDSSDAEILELLRIVGLADAGRKKVKAFSLGMKQRLGIAIALLGSPELLVLDEPVNGLDPMGMKDVRDIIQTISHQHGVSFLISSHLLGELEKISTVYGIVNYGVLTEEISAAELTRMCSGYVYFRVSDPQQAAKLIYERLSIPDVYINENYIEVKVDAGRSAEINRQLVYGGIDVFEQGVRKTDAEDYLLQRMSPVNV